MTIFDSTLSTESDRFLEEVLAAAPDARVPSCPDWTADDLLWHLGTVQAFWAEVLRRRPADPDEWHSEPVRPEGREALRAFFEEATAALRDELGRASDGEPAWTWHADQSVAFIRRRQAHEATIHRIDAELAAGRPVTEIEPELAWDGVLECLGVMYAGVPDWAEFTPDGATVELVPTDGGEPVRVVLGRTVGHEPDGDPIDEPDLALVAPAGPADVTVRATASHLDAWLWHRAEGGVDVEGDEDVYARFASIVSQPVN
jgi:uncharacterized protein (TIGR03083 family)